jgi:stalled ribosome rescue protein Dom34
MLMKKKGRRKRRRRRRRRSNSRRRIFLFITIANKKIEYEKYSIYYFLLIFSFLDAQIRGIILR